MFSIIPAMTRPNCRSLVVIFMAGSFASFAGCGGSEIPLAPVSGIVTDGGEPVIGAMVEFFPENGRTSVGQTKEGGVFTMKHGDEEGVVIGSCKVQITPGAVAPPPSEGDDVVAPPMKGPPEVIVVPERVSVEDTDANNFVFELDDYKKKSGKK